MDTEGKKKIKYHLVFTYAVDTEYTKSSNKRHSHIYQTQKTHGPGKVTHIFAGHRRQKSSNNSTHIGT